VRNLSSRKKREAQEESLKYFNISKLPSGGKQMIFRKGDAFDCMRVMGEMVSQTVKNPSLIEFVRRNPMDEKEIFNFAYGIASFKPDKKNKNTVKSPFATMRTHRANCVCYAVLIAALLVLNGIGGRFRAIREYNDWRYPKPKHIYVISNNNIVMDPVLGQDQKHERSRRERKNKIGHFGAQTKYFSSFDKPF